MVELNQSHFQVIMVMAVILLGTLFVLPFLSVILFATVLAYLTYPVYQKLRKKIPDSIAAFSICIGLLLVLATLVNYGVSFILHEMGSIYLLVAKAQESVFGATFSDVARLVVTKSIAYLSNQVSLIPSLIVSTFLLFIALFYFLTQGKEIFDATWKIIPLSEGKRSILLKDIRTNVDAFVFVTLAIGILQGIVAALGFVIFGLSYPFIAALLAAVLSIIPVIGPYLLYAGIGTYLILQDSTSIAIGILIYGLLIGSIIDYVARPYLFSRRVKTHPLVVFLGIFGGMYVLGIPGIIVGPIVLSVSIAFIKDLHLYGVK